MNRKQRRSFRRALTKNGAPNRIAKGYTIALDAVSGRNLNQVFESEDPVKLNTKSVFERASTSRYSNAYVNFVANNKDKMFHVVRLDKYPNGQIVGLLEDDTFLFYAGDLTPAKG